MTLAELLASLLSDPLRIGLMIGLVITMLRTRAQTGTVLPLVAGVVFVAVLLAMTAGGNGTEPMWRLVAVGALANAIWLGIVLGAYTIYTRFK